MQNIWRASKILSTSELAERLVTSYFYLTCSHLQCYQGTPVFIARAVQMGKAVPLSAFQIVPTVPNSPEPYASNHPDRINKFPPGGEELVIRASTHSNSRQWRHELDHDAESVFWLLLLWL